MIESWATQRPVRSLFAVSALLVGFAVATLFLRQNSFTLAIAIFSISLAALVGGGKLASP